MTSRLEWREPLSVLAGWGDYAPALALISDGRGWSYLAHGFHVIDTQGSLEDLTAMLGPQAPSFEGPPFSGGVAGLAAYDFAARIEALDLGPDGAWPRLTLLGVSALLAFDHDRREVWAVGRGEDGAGAARRCVDAAGLMNGTATPFSGQLCVAVAADDPAAFEAAVADVRRRIGEGEIFQANIARRWSGRLEAGASPLDLMVRLSEKSPAPLSAYLRLPDLALVSNSPESFVTVRSGVVTTRPIKGTAPRGANPAEDAVNKAALAASAKDRAENLMIVDLMRNDLARVCEPGSVATPELFRPVTFANVHHLVSTVTGRLKAGVTAADLLRAVFPAGSITGAPKVQAMKVIAELEPPRGPFFGSLFWAGFDGAFESSVLIRTVALEQDARGWRFEARAGGGITADSKPHAERLETEDKISAILAALTEQA